MVIQVLVTEHGMSQRRACQASGIARLTLRYRALNELVEVCGAPLSIRLDNGPEFIADALAKWAQSKGIALTISSQANPPRTPRRPPKLLHLARGDLMR